MIFFYFSSRTLLSLILQVKESDVDLVYNSTGHCTGIAYVSFPSNDLAHTAVRHKHRQYIGRRYVELSTF